MNGKSQENADYGDFNFKKDDIPNMFAPTNQEAKSQMPAATMPFASNKGTVTTPGALQGTETPPYCARNTPIHGFADAGQGSAWRYANPQLSAISYAPAMNPVPPGIENQLPAYQQQFVNPYADYWAQMQQAGGAPPAIQMDVDAFPNHFQNGNQFHQPAGMITQPGFIPNALQTLTPYTSQKTAKKKGVKATAYDIMRDFSTNIPMFTHKQEVYIYNEEKY